MSTENKIQEESLGIYDDMSVDRAKDTKGTVARLLKQLFQQKWKLLTVIISVIFGSAFTMTSPLIIAGAINHILNGIKLAFSTGTTFNVNFETMGDFMLALMALYLFGAAFSYLREYIMAGVAETLTLSMRGDLSEKLSKLPLRYYDRHKKGEILSRVTSDLEKVSGTLQEGLMQLISAVVNIIGGVIIMIIINPILAVIAIVTVMLGIAATAMVTGKSRGLFAKNQQALGEMNGMIEEFFTGQLIVKAFNKQQDSVEAVKAANQKLCEVSRKAQFITHAITPTIRFFNQISYVVVAVLGAVFVTQGRLSIGVIQAFFQYMNQVSEPVTEASYIFNSLQAAVASAERVFEVMDEVDESPDVKICKVLPEAKGAIRFEHVRFGYSDDDILMEDINIDIKAGQKIACLLYTSPSPRDTR